MKGANPQMPMSHSFSVILEPQPSGGFTVLVPALPEVVSEGDTEQEALGAPQEAIRAVLVVKIKRFGARAKLSKG